MFRKKIYISSELLVIGKRKITWSKIRGIREQSGKNLQIVSYSFPRADIFLEGGKVVAISNRNIFLIKDKKTDDFKTIACREAIEAIRNRATNTKVSIDNWIEWRLVLPIAICEMIVAGTIIARKPSVDTFVLSVITAGVVGLAIGFYWEKHKRKKMLSR